MICTLESNPKNYMTISSKANAGGGVYIQSEDGAACRTRRLALTLVATNAAPTSPRVFGTELLIANPSPLVRLCSSALKDSTARRRERPTKMTRVLSG